MKILLVILHADSSRGGAELYTVRLFNKLLEAEHEVFIAAGAFEPSIPMENRVSLDTSGHMRLTRYLSFVESLESHLRIENYDVVHAMLPVPRCDLYHPHAGIESISWSETSFLQQLTNARRQTFVDVEAALLGAPPRPLTLCLSDRARLQAAKIFPKAAELMLTLYSGVDESKFVPVDRAPNAKPVVLFIGQDFQRKGLDVAINAIAQVPNAVLRVIGKDAPGAFKAQADRLGLQNRVEFLGARDDVPAQLANADALVLPSRQEPFGMVAAEALLMGVPPVVSQNAGASEIIFNGVDGRVVAGEGAGDWAEAIKDVIANREKYRAEALLRREELSYDSHLRKLMDVYERIVAERVS
jgi:UDP-glucose:(heptosyl)LPS alpha-1,3-glucosyltransferase